MAELSTLMPLAWFVVVLVIFRQLPPGRAVLAAFVAGLLFLPVLKKDGGWGGQGPTPLALGSLFMLTKTNTISVAALLGALCFDAQRLFATRPRWFDLPMAAWLLCPLISDYGIDEPINNLYGQTRDHFLQWGVPYWLGRTYLGTLPELRDAAIAMIVGALAYVPFCLYEIIKGPYLHLLLFGWFQHDPGQSERFGGHRPIVFTNHGLETGFWMVMAALVAFWLWRTKALESIRWKATAAPIPMLWVISLLGVMAVLVKSTGALVLGIAGAGVLAAPRKLRPLLLVPLLVVPPLYIGVRTTGAWTGTDLVQWLTENFDKDRAQSIAFRFNEEKSLIRHAQERSWTGWGDTGKALAVPKKTKWDKPPIPDGYWIITFGCYGFLGLIALHVTMLLPSALFLWKCPGATWADPRGAAAAVAATILPLFMIDCLSNAMINTFYILVVGGLATLVNSGALTGEEKALSESAAAVVEEADEPVLIAPPARELPAAGEPPPGVLVRRRPSAR